MYGTDTAAQRVWEERIRTWLRDGALPSRR
jgi:hypothetical protein